MGSGAGHVELPDHGIDAWPALTEQLGSLTRRFSHSDGADNVLSGAESGPLAVVTGFGPTNAPTAGTLTVMLGIVELQRKLDVPTTVVTWRRENGRVSGPLGPS